MSPGGFTSRRFPVGLVLTAQSSFPADWEKGVEGKALLSFGLPFSLQYREWLEAREEIRPRAWHSNWEASAPVPPAARPPPSAWESQVSAHGSDTKGSGGEGRSLTVLGSNLGLVHTSCVTSGRSFHLSEPVSSRGTYLRVALWGVQEWLPVKRKVQHWAYKYP